MKISFITLGCKLNQAETDEMKRDLAGCGFLIVPFGRKTDMAVVRACGVTCGASRTTREMIRRAKKTGAYVVAVGCLENKNMPEIDFVGKNNEVTVKYILKLRARENKIFRDDTGCAEDKEINRTRAMVKIQTGCNFNCAYCIIPSLRGRAASLPAKKIITEIKKRKKENFREIVLTGVNICQYRDGRTGLAGLLKKILKKTKITRIRLGSLDPRLIPKELITLYPHPRLMPHWHLSLQSGSDKILKAMRRFYTAKKYLAIVAAMRRRYPLFSFTTDIIVGFPGETEKDFLDSCDIIKKARFAKVHIFPFSPRPGTTAVNLPGQIKDGIKTERVKKLVRVADRTADAYAKQFVRQKRPVLFENKKAGFYSGYTPEFVRVKMKSAKNITNQIKDFTITSARLVRQ